jgi:hypothetical protein
MASEEQIKIKNQTNHIFNVSEKALMTFMSKFLDEPASVLFNDAVPQQSEPVILLPIPEYDKDIHFKFSLDVIENKTYKSKKRIDDINKVIEHKLVRDTIGFLFYAVKNVFPSIIATMDNNKPLANIVMELDEINWVFYPVFKNDKLIKKSYYEDSLMKMEYYLSTKKDDIDENELKSLNDQIENFTKLLNEIELTNDDMNLDFNMNKLYANKHTISINLNELSREELPRPDKMKFLPKISSEEYVDAV